jgi:hypothetical protein
VTLADVHTVECKRCSCKIGQARTLFPSKPHKDTRQAIQLAAGCPDNWPIHCSAQKICQLHCPPCCALVAQDKYIDGLISSSCRVRCGKWKACSGRKFYSGGAVVVKKAQRSATPQSAVLINVNWRFCRQRGHFN